MLYPRLRMLLTAGVVLSLASLAHGGTLYVANNGLDGPACGPKTTPCRSITQGISNAAAGDTIIVGPGLYGDLNDDGTPGDSPGEETPSPGCGCMLSVNKGVTLISSDGAAGTIIDARFVGVNTNVLLIPPGGGTFGKPGHGFTVTNTVRINTVGIEIDASNVVVGGNQVLGGLANVGTGIDTVVNDGEVVLIEGNQVVGWLQSIVASSSGKTVQKNLVQQSNVGISASASSAIVGNVATDNGSGIVAQDSAEVVGNAAYGNEQGLSVLPGFTGKLERNNLFGNKSHCGLTNGGVSGLVAANNYWGAATGPGPDPADDVCNMMGGTTTVTPFATKPFSVKASIKL